MDAVLAVSTLAMVSAIAWADCVISCYGVGSEAMSYMVRSAKQGEDTKMAITQKPSVQFASFLKSAFLRVSTTLWSSGKAAKLQ